MGGVRLGDLEQLAVGLRGGERCAIAAIGGHGRGADHRAAGIAYRYGRAGLAAAGDDGAAAADCCRQAKRRGDVGRVHGCFGRDIACRIGLGDLEQLAIGLRRGEGDAEAATGSDQGGAERIAGGVMDAHRRARLAGAGHHRAVRRHARHGRGGRGDVRRGQADGRRMVAGAIGLPHRQRSAIGLGRGERDEIAAIARDHGGADGRAARAGDGDGGARLAGAGDRGAVRRDRRGRRCGGDDVRRRHACGGRDIAAGIRLGDRQRAAVRYARGQRHRVGAVRADDRGAHRGAGIGIAHGDGSAGLAGAGHCRAVRRDAGRRCGGGREIGRGDDGGRRMVAGRIGLHHGHRLAVEHGGRQRYRIAAIRIGDGAAQRPAIGIGHRHRRAGLGASRDGEGVRIHYGGGRAGRSDVGRREIDGVRSIARRIGLRDRERPAIVLRRGERHGVAALRIDDGGTDHRVAAVAYRHGRPGLAGAGDDRPVGVYRAGGRRRRGGVGRMRRGGGRDIAGRIGLGDGDRLAIVLGLGERHGVAAVAAHRAAAEQRARGVAHLHGGARLARAGHAGAIAAHRRGGGAGRSGVHRGGGTAATARSATAARQRRRAPGHGDAPEQDRKQRTASAAGGSLGPGPDEEIVDPVQRREARRSRRRRIRQPEMIAFANDEIARRPICLDIEIGDTDRLAIGEMHDQVVALPLQGGDLRPVDVEPNHAGAG